MPAPTPSPISATDPISPSAAGPPSSADYLFPSPAPHSDLEGFLEHFTHFGAPSQHSNASPVPPPIGSTVLPPLPSPTDVGKNETVEKIKEEIKLPMALDITPPNPPDLDTIPPMTPPAPEIVPPGGSLPPESSSTPVPPNTPLPVELPPSTDVKAVDDNCTVPPESSSTPVPPNIPLPVDLPPSADSAKVGTVEDTGTVSVVMDSFEIDVSMSHVEAKDKEVLGDAMEEG
jgi:hypothetical protein